VAPPPALAPALEPLALTPQCAAVSRPPPPLDTGQPPPPLRSLTALLLGARFRRRCGGRGRGCSRRCRSAAATPHLHEVLTVVLAAAFRAFDRALVQIVEARAAALAGALRTPVRLDHAETPGNPQQSANPGRERGRMSRAFHPVKTKFRHARRAPRRIAALREGRLTATTTSPKLLARPIARLQGRVRAPGDKSVSHRVLMLGALALGETTVRGLLEGEDVLSTAGGGRGLGAEIRHERGGGLWRIRGFGVGGGREPADVLELGNSGTSARLLSGILASHPFTSFMTGDAS